MKVSSGGAAGIRAGQAYGSAGQKSVGGLIKGDSFTATVVGVSGGSVSLMLEGGGQITAKSQNPDALKKGEQLSFTVEANENGQVFVKMSKADEKSLIKIAAKALTDAGLPANEKNISAAKALIERNIQTDPEKLHKAAFGMSLETMTPEKLMFFLEENIEISEESLKRLNDTIINKNGLAAEISRLIEGALSLTGDERASVLRLLLDGHKLQKLPNGKAEQEKELRKALFLDVLGDKALGDYYKSIHSSAVRLLSQTEEIDCTKELLEAARNIKAAIEFQNEIKEYRYFMQIPFVLGEKMGQGDLFVFKDGSGAKDYQKHVTALLSLDLRFGHIEAFIVKKQRSVTCAFGLPDAASMKLFNDNCFELHKLLAQKGCKLENVSFEKLDGAFSLLKESPAESKETKPAQKRYTFDMKA